MQDPQLAILQLSHWPHFFFLDLTGILDMTTGIVDMTGILDLTGIIGLDGHFLLSGQLNRLGDLYGGDVPLASLATEESEFTMPSSEGFWIFFFFFGDILMEMDERKNQLLL